jgi:hypothetical protein
MRHSTADLAISHPECITHAETQETTIPHSPIEDSGGDGWMLYCALGVEHTLLELQALHPMQQRNTILNYLRPGACINAAASDVRASVEWKAAQC